MTTGPQFVEQGYRLNRETAGTGGIRKIESRKLVGERKQIAITGILLEPIPRPSAPNYNKRLPTGSMIGLPDYEIAHVWGPGFGDEAWDGMMYAPRAVNQRWQNHGVEKSLRGMRVAAARENAEVELVATASSHAETWKGNDLLHEASYVFSIVGPRIRRWIGRVELVVGPPESPTVEYGGYLLPW